MDFDANYYDSKENEDTDLNIAKLCKRQVTWSLPEIFLFKNFHPSPPTYPPS